MLNHSGSEEVFVEPVVVVLAPVDGVAVSLLAPAADLLDRRGADLGVELVQPDASNIRTVVETKKG